MKKAMVDTEIWAISKKKPDERKLTSREKFIKALKMHQKAKLFFRNTFPKLKVYMSLHQLAEIYHVLAFRGIKIPREDVESIIEALPEKWRKKIEAKGDLKLKDFTISKDKKKF